MSCPPAIPLPAYSAQCKCTVTSMASAEWNGTVLSANKIAKCGEKGILLLVERGVPGIVDDDEPRVRDRLVVGFAKDRWHKSILVAPDEQSRHRDAVQPFCEMRVVEPRLVGEPRHGAAVLGVKMRADLCHVAEAARGALLVGIKAPQILLDRHAEDVVDRFAAGGYADRADQREARQPRLVAYRQLCGDPAA